ncbi:2-oxo acid dehydrogenase subunit E2 [Nocardioides sp. NPDC006273]|uniref:2-oxo acid dehydrogenase subunit E2 n=1 Tax=Nocardioides sp. NPDC006273 TaxID=3155598 RepID=UPI0033AC491B
MPIEIRLPGLGESVTEGTITRWLKSPGDHVAADEPLLEVTTDKVDTEIPSPVAGILQEILAQEDETVEVGAVLGVVGDQSVVAPPEAPSEPEVEPTAPQADDADVAGNASEVTVELPSLGESVTEGTITRWLKSPGDHVAVDEPLLEVSTDKVDTEIPSPAEGVLLRVLAEEDEQIAVGAALAVIGSSMPVDAGEVPTSGADAVPDDTATSLDTVERPVGDSADVGTTQAPQPSPTPAPSVTNKSEELRGTTQGISRLRSVIARRMTESLQVAAQLTQVVEIDLTGVARLREMHKAAFQQREGVKLTYLPFFVKATTEVLPRHPALNSSLDVDAGTVTYYDHEHIAMAVDTVKGLYTPVIRNAGELSIAGIANRIADLAHRTRTNSVSPDELTGGTFTITNIGSFGALFDTPIINQPQVAILGPGAVVKRPMVISDPALGDIIGIRSMAYFSLTYDHRVVDGADAGRFLADLKRTLEGAEFDL